MSILPQRLRSNPHKLHPRHRHLLNNDLQNFQSQSKKISTKEGQEDWKETRKRKKEIDADEEEESKKRQREKRFQQLAPAEVPKALVPAQLPPEAFRAPQGLSLPTETTSRRHSHSFVRETAIKRDEIQIHQLPATTLYTSTMSNSIVAKHH